MIASRPRNVVPSSISYAGVVQLPVPVRRIVYRTGYRALTFVWMVRRPDLHGVKCVITDGDSVLLVRHTYGAPRWDLPGGRVARAEPPLLTARREMHEELGLQIADWTSLGELHVSIDHRRDTIHLFRAEIGRPPVRIDRGELAVARWFSRGELPVDLAPHVVPILARAEPSNA
jgi:8-oxo-dGTP pyrophosphatase MutT (NUDIX family)